MSATAPFEWPAGQQDDVGNSRMIRGQALGLRLGSASVIVIVPDTEALVEFRRLSGLQDVPVDARACPWVSVEITKQQP